MKLLFFHRFYVYFRHSNIEIVDFALIFVCISCIQTRRLGQLAGPVWAVWAGCAGGGGLEQPRAEKY